MRISTTTLESYRLWRDPEQDWMSEQDLIDGIMGKFVPTHKVELGSAFGQVLEDPDRYRIRGGYQCGAFQFGTDVMAEPLAVIDRRGVFEAKAARRYGDIDVVAKADHLLGSHLSEYKTTLSAFNVEKYLDSYQWRFMTDIFVPSQITYHVFCLAEATNGVISLKSIETFNVWPYAACHADCVRLLAEFTEYVTARGLDAHLRQRQLEAV